MKVSKATPAEVQAFLKALDQLGGGSIEQVRALMKAQWPPVRAARTFAMQHGLAVEHDGTLELSENGQRLRAYSDGKWWTFLSGTLRLQDQEPFAFARDLLAARKSMSGR